jgi:hypothetical protein
MIILLSSCGNDPEPKRIDVYLGGNYFNETAGTSGVYQAAYWKNGELNTISQGEGYVELMAVSKDGKDFYAFGRTADDAASKTIWKNGVATTLFSAVTSSAYIYDMEVYDGDVYVVGNETGSGISRAAIWKNGEIQYLDADLVAGGAADILVDGNDLYIMGWNESSGGSKIVYWKNGVKTIVTPNEVEQWAFSIAISDDNVYVLGERENVYGIWKNGVFTAIEGQNPDFWQYRGELLVKGSDVYAFGEDVVVTDNEYKACYWKNGVRTFVEGTSDYSTVISAVMTSKGIYAVGYEDYEGPDYNSVLWHNWNVEEPIFPRSVRKGYVESIAVAEY